MIVSRRGLLVTMLGLPAAALVRPQAGAPPAVASVPAVGSAGAEIVDEFRGSSVSMADVQATIDRGNRKLYRAIVDARRRGHPDFRDHGPRRPS